MSFKKTQHCIETKYAGWSATGLPGILFLLLWLIAAMPACTLSTTAEDEIILAEVGTERLSLNQAILRIPALQLMSDSAGAVHKYRDQWIREQVLVNEAKRRNLQETEAFKTAKKQFERQLLQQLLMDQQLHNAETASVSREEAMRFYEQHRDRFVLQERHVRFHHMIAPTMAEATRARNDLMRGVEWNTIAENYSTQPEYSIRNSTLFHPLSEALSELTQLAQFLNVIGVTEVSPIRVIDGNYHFVQLLENQDEGTVPELDWTLSQIQDWLAITHRNNQLNAFKQNLIRQAEANRQIRQFQ
ncbi:MAG: peptidyl-prolyl cis-trans isomerase [Balneolales bacterium]|nr:peptidyl-prolyl cis-trans isomerase [Balneolales bacterium]